ncbi:FKBP-type peptidyl-prolyl cis-trans isomerase [Xanthovirga aplysinae]|uniref:FKBP-type peptidyl-prolyl cis-trans isomerase n=1 Tax=Xanthovirga aplysinae TaxID=2529853 RepID=UPI0012BD586C|nr:peptidylprolyl isomerase [Xanthovirga aplysinae]MTI32272.1 peptidylprolyl isomerase [Xanthovirga aplysinae]
MSKAKSGDKVKVHYKGTLKDGSVFDSSEGREPLEFELGAGNMIVGFEKAVLGLEVGEQVKVEIPADEAYGSKRDDMMIEVPKEQVPADIKPEKGMQLMLQQPNGSPLQVIVTEVKAEGIVLDANHPLAGKDLIFDIELVEIV